LKKKYCRSGILGNKDRLLGQKGGRKKKTPFISAGAGGLSVVWDCRRMMHHGRTGNPKGGRGRGINTCGEIGRGKNVLKWAKKHAR